MQSRFSPAWHRGEAAAFSRFVGTQHASPVDHEDPVHKERLARYDRNIAYYLESQYAEENQQALAANDFLGMRVNYTSIARRSVDMKADWLFGDPVGIHAISLDEVGEPVKTEDDKLDEVKDVKDRINQIRKFNRMNFWDWVMAVMGITCGDFFVVVDAQPDDEHPTITLQDPSYVFPDYPENLALPMRACQIQYNVDGAGDATDEDTMASRRITEDYRLEVIEKVTDVEELDELDVLDEDELEGRIADAEEAAGSDEEFLDQLKLVCVYRKFEDGNIVPGSMRQIGVPVIPIVHGRNSYIWNTRYGEDEVENLIPRIEKYNEMFYYAERVARMNAHAKLFLSGVQPGEDPVRSDFDDVIYGGKDASAQVISLNTDTSVLEMVTGALERELHRASNVPVIASGESESGYGAASGFALLIRHSPLISVNKRHRTTYGDALDAIYELCLIFDEMVIQGRDYGEVYDYGTFEFQYDWKDQMPRALGEIIGDMVSATSGKPLMSVRSAQERIPGLDPDQEKARMQAEAAEEGQQSLETPEADPFSLDQTAPLPDAPPLPDQPTPPGVVPPGQTKPPADPSSPGL